MNDQQRAAMQHYEAALKAAFPEGATDEVFYHWDEARKALAQPKKPDECANGCPERTICDYCATQPQGEWVDLTDDEIQDVFVNTESGFVSVIHAVIAKFKEKNTPPVVPQGEPVVGAYEVVNESGTEWELVYPAAIHKHKMIPEHRITQTFYTTPPVVLQGEWVDLTDDDIVEFEDSHLVNYRIPLGGQYDFAEAVITKFKSKNTPPVVPQGEPVGYVTEPQNLLPNGLTLLQTNPDCAVQLNSGRDFGWLYMKGADGQWVTHRKLSPEEINEAQDQAADMVVVKRESVFEKMFAAPIANPPVVPQEPVYAFRRKGLDDFCTCDERRYLELSDKPNLFETTIFYTTPPSVEAAIEATKEKAAKVCDDLAEKDLNARSAFDVPSAADCAAAIRSMK